ncbi:TadE/TadG family type IV pilus assembly protein [Pseudogemmobacter faecipullorum]|uniref:Pilus assembly protein n=1 Tax=Pseudogemmobacter faecipullorum TaxID=2755041 RepID=A0ABS8CHA3_9RHOB|nr:TadE/TadG family type IV pilus assembly protein [Pseudogemmobacter faecipullorum]MCB5408739.1 pilus assembly protein [Pseudogemmobacter faecipullorum]
MKNQCSLSPARLIRRWLGNEDGAITVEFVIIFPLLLALLVLIVFVSMLISTASDVQQVAHELARQSVSRLSRSAPPADVCKAMASDQAMIDQLLRQSVLLKSKDLKIQPCPTSPDAQGFVTVTVTYNFAGSFVQALGRNFGVDLGILTRVSTTKL